MCILIHYIGRIVVNTNINKHKYLLLKNNMKYYFWLPHGKSRGTKYHDIMFYNTIKYNSQQFIKYSIVQYNIL